MIGLNPGLLARLAPKSREALEKLDVSIRVGEDLDDPEMKHPISTLSRVRSEAAEPAFHAAADWIAAPEISLASAVPIGACKCRPGPRDGGAWNSLAQRQNSAPWLKVAAERHPALMPAN
jgi:hypothetical protein